MIKYGIWHIPSHQGSGWCSGYFTDPASRLDHLSFVSNINDAYKELAEWTKIHGQIYEVREVKE